MSKLLPDYVSSAKSLPMSARVPWYKSSAPAYAGVMLWIVFWQDIAAGSVISGTGFASTVGGTLAAGLLTPILAIIVGALICHYGSYLAPGLMGQKTGLSLAVVGTSTYGTTGGFLMPGFFMGVLQFGWLGVNAYFSAKLLAMTAGQAVNGPVHMGIGIVWAIGAAFIGLKGIQYVAKISTYLPLIPFVILVLLFVMTVGGVSGFDPAIFGGGTETAAIVPENVYAQVETSVAAEAPLADAAVVEEVAVEAPLADAAMVEEVAVEAPLADAAMVEEVAVEAPLADAAVVEEVAVEAPVAAPVEGEVKQGPAMDSKAIFLALVAYIVGFFATAGAAGVGLSSSCRTTRDAHLAGWGGVVGVTCFSAILSVLIVAGAYGTPAIAEKLSAVGNPMQVPMLMDAILGSTFGKVCMFGLAIAAFPSACFCSLVAAQSFQNTMPKVNPFISCGLGTLGAILLVVTAKAGDAGAVFGIIGASFGPICGAMTADYLLAGCNWPGPRDGFNPAGWLSWGVGFVLGIWNNFGFCTALFTVPCPPVVAIVTGFVLYVIFAKMGMLSRSIEFHPTEG